MPFEKVGPYSYDNNTCVEQQRSFSANTDGLPKGGDYFEFCKPRDKKFDPTETNWFRDTLLFGESPPFDKEGATFRFIGYQPVEPPPPKPEPPHPSCCPCCRPCPPSPPDRCPPYCPDEDKKDKK